MYTFTLDKDKNILWEGDFKYARFGMPNNYKTAFKQYIDDACLDKECLKLAEFKQELIKYFHDTTNPINKYTILVQSDKNKIDMVDPSGGPYISAGYDMGIFSKHLKGLIVIDFVRIDTGYKIITDNTVPL